MQNMATLFARAVHAEETWWGLVNLRITVAMSVKYAQLTGAIERSAQVACVGRITSESVRAQRRISIAKRAAKSLSSTVDRLNTAGMIAGHGARWKVAKNLIAQLMDTVECTRLGWIATGIL